MTTPHEQALLLRLAACTIKDEPQSIFVLRRILRDKGWTDEAMDGAVARVRAAVGVTVTQSRFAA